MSSFSLSSSVFLSTLLLNGIGQASERTVPCKSLPEAVQKQSESLLDGGTARRCAMNVSGTETSWKIELMSSGLSKEITFDSSGKVIAVEQEVFSNSLPSEIQHAVTAVSHGDHVTQVRLLTRGGMFVSYEVTFNHKHNRREVSIGADGLLMKAD